MASTRKAMVAPNSNPLGLQLTVTEQEIFCSLSLKNNPDLLSEQQAVADSLSYFFEHGGGDNPRDLHKAEKYRKQAHPEPPPPPEKVGFFKRVKKALKRLAKTVQAYNILGWYTSIRLFLVRFNRVLATQHFLEGYTLIRNSLMGKIFAYAGLSYGLELIVDIGIVLHSTFRKPTAEEAKLSRFTRFKNVLLKDDRPYRMANAAVWVVANALGIILTGGLSVPIIIIGAFAFDAIHEMIKAWREYKQHKNMLDKITTKLTALQETNLNHKNDSEINKLQALQTSLKEKMKANLKSRIHPIATTALIVVGMALFFFPPTAIPAAALLGAAIALGAGSIIAGLGRRLWRLIKPAAAPTKPSIEPTCETQAASKSSDTSTITTRLSQQPTAALHTSPISTPPANDKTTQTTTATDAPTPLIGTPSSPHSTLVSQSLLAATTQSPIRRRHTISSPKLS